ncbi:SPOR domain-containing protein [Piscinibacterium candidicorallinum]|uniref:SPOR domain-containing protein n=1 Tax=Piscinibacterium candidicorallinum TaxID=1793872 RepID=A0ABV7H435_9BURK
MTNAVLRSATRARVLAVCLMGLGALLAGLHAFAAAAAEPAAVLTIARPAPPAAKDESPWVSSPGWPAGQRVIVTATDSGRVARATTQAPAREGGALFSMSLARALQMDATRAAPLLIRADPDTRGDARRAPSTGLPPGLRGGADVAALPLPAELGVSAEASAASAPAASTAPATPSVGPAAPATAAAAIAPAPTPASTPAARASTSAAGAGGALYLQVGAFAEEPKAWNVFSMVRRMAWPPDVRPEVYFSEGLSRVRIGPFANAQDRDAARARLREVLGDTPIDLVR